MSEHSWPTSVSGHQDRPQGGTTLAVRCAHEAAHAVAAAGLGGQIHRIEVNASSSQIGGQCWFSTNSDHDSALALVAPGVATRAYLARLGLNHAMDLTAVEASCAGDHELLPALTSRSLTELEAEATALVNGRAFDDVLELADLIVAEGGVVDGTHPALQRIQARQHPRHAADQTPTTDLPLTTAMEGRTAMSVDEIRSAIAEVEQRVSTAAGQLSTVRGELDDAAGLLAQISQGSNAAELADALGALRALSDELEQAGQRAINTGETALAYAGRL